MAALSTGANVGAFIGIADIVIKYAGEAIQLYTRCRGASKYIPRLLNELQLLKEIMEEVRAFMIDYNQSPYVLKDSQIMVPQLEKVLRGCHGELAELKNFLNDLTATPGLGIVARLTKNLHWGLGDEKILNSRNQLEGYKLSLTWMLSIIGRKNEITIRKQLSETREDIAAIGTAQLNTNSTLSCLQGNLATVSNTIQATVQSSQTALSKSLDTHTANLEQGLHQRFDNIEAAIGNITITKKQDGEVLFYGQNMRAVVFSLLLIQSDFIKIIRDLTRNKGMKVSPSEACWIENQFEVLLNYGAASEDFRHPSSRVSSTSRWQPYSRAPSTSRWHPDFKRLSDSSCQSDPTRKKPRIKHRFQQKIPISAGTLLVQKSSFGDTNSSIEQYRLVFIPNLTSSPATGLIAAFSRQWQENAAPRIMRCLTTFNVIPHSSKIWHYLAQDDIASLRGLLVDGQAHITVNDQDENGMSLLTHAIRHSSLEVCNYLLREGCLLHTSENFTFIIPYITSGTSSTSPDNVVVHDITVNQVLINLERILREMSFKHEQHILQISVNY